VKSRFVEANSSRELQPVKATAGWRGKTYVLVHRCMICRTKLLGLHQPRKRARRVPALSGVGLRRLPPSKHD
jgi:hypothetical protein